MPRTPQSHDVSHTRSTAVVRRAISAEEARGREGCNDTPASRALSERTHAHRSAVEANEPGAHKPANTWHIPDSRPQAGKHLGARMPNSRFLAGGFRSGDFSSDPC